MNTKISSSINTIVLGLIFLGILFSCKEEFEEAVSVENNTINLSLAADDISYTTTNMNFSLNYIPTINNYEAGVCYDTIDNPTIEKNKVIINNISDLQSNVKIADLTTFTTFYARSYLKHTDDVIYSSSVQWKTLDARPIIETQNISEIKALSAKVNVSTTSPAGFDIMQRGICWSKSDNPDLESNFTTDNLGSNSFIATIEGLEANNNYKIRAYAKNSEGITYGNQLSLSTLDGQSSLATSEIENITATSATCVGNITDDGGDAIIARGVCYSKNQNPTINDNKTIDGSGLGTFESNLSSLSVDTKYYVRAYATNNVGTKYGNEVSFSTHDGLPSGISTIQISDIKATTATGGGSITNNGGFNITAKGVCWSINYNPTITDFKSIDGTGTDAFSSNLTSLSTNTTYYVRAYATNINGTVYGENKEFKTLDGIPSLSTNEVTEIASTSAECGGNVTDDGGDNITIKGVCWSTNENPTVNDNKTNDGAGTGVFTSNITNLSVNTTYFVRAYASNSITTEYGNEHSFTTLDGLPQITTTEVTNVTEPIALSGGNIIDDGGFEITSRGVCWSTSSNPTINDFKTEDGTGSGSFESNLNNLVEGTTYYLRAYATNAIGTVYGEEYNFLYGFIVGQTYQGGVITYFFKEGDPGYVAGEKHGLIVTENKVGNAAWGCKGTYIGETSEGIGTGMANTIAIINNCSDSNTAAKMCYNLNLNGYSDWYLPSIDELVTFYSGGSTYIWSSSEFSSTHPWRYDRAQMQPGTGHEKDEDAWQVYAFRTF